MIMGPVQSFADLLADPQCIANDYVVELEHPTVGTLREVGTPIYLSETPGRAPLGRRPSSASTPKRCCSSTATTGSRSRSYAPRGAI